METPCIEALGETGRLLEGLGHVVEEVPLPYDEWEVLRASITLAAAHSAAVVSGLEQKYGRRQVRSSLEETILLLATMGRVFPAEVPAEARQTGLRIGSELAAYFSRYDVLLTPTLGRVPVPLDQAKPSAAEQQMVRLLISAAGARALRVGRVRDAIMQAQLARLTQQAMHRTMAANLTGVPAMSVPLYRTENDLPVGVQFTARFGDEATLLSLAAQLERAKPWRVRR